MPRSKSTSERIHTVSPWGVSEVPRADSDLPRLVRLSGCLNVTTADDAPAVEEAVVLTQLRTVVRLLLVEIFGADELPRVEPDAFEPSPRRVVDRHAHWMPPSSSKTSMPKRLQNQSSS